MIRNTILASLLVASAAPALASTAPSAAALKAASHALAAYHDQVVDSLAHMVSFNTVADKAVPFEQNPQFAGFKRYLKDEAQRLGFDYADDGWVVTIGMGHSPERIGIITHGDVQPADPSKWKKSPYQLDATSEPGRLIARGSEDDKGPIATALYAMKAIADQHLPLKKRIELIVYMGEESDWDGLTAFLKTHQPPQMNITLDSEYPAVTAEKGFGMVVVGFAKQGGVAAPAGEPSISAFGGGFFAAQIPEDARAVVANATPALEAQIRARAAKQAGMHYRFEWKGSDLAVTAKGHSAHSSMPENGVNAISMLADALAVRPWADTPAGALVNFLNEMVGTGYFAEKFGHIAYRDEFMGPMTFAPTVIREQDGVIGLGINVRRPRGKSGEQLTAEINAALGEWQARHVPLAMSKVQLSDPWVQDDAPQVPLLMSVFSHFTGARNPKPIAIGGATNSRLFPHAVSFGPAMPHAVYTGHTEHEFISRKQLLLNLQMYTAALVEMAQ